MIVPEVDDKWTIHLSLTLHLHTAKFDVHLEGKKSWSVGTVVKLDLSGTPKCVKLHLQNRKIQEDEWIDIESPRLAPLYSKVKRPPKKENPKQTKVTKNEKLSDISKKTHGKPSKRSPLEGYISGERPVMQDRLSVIHTDDSSMADIFTQDSDSEVDEALLSKNDENLPRLTTTKDYQSPSELDDTMLEDSDDNDETVTKAPSGMKHVPITDDSSPGGVETRKGDRTTVDASLRWTIPKKKTSPTKISLLPANESAPADVSSIPRIPRKKRVDAAEASGSSAPNPKIDSPEITQKTERQLSLPIQVDYDSTAITSKDGPGRTRSLVELNASPRNSIAVQEDVVEPSHVATSASMHVGFARPYDKDYRLGGPRRQGIYVHSPNDRLSRSSGDGQIRHPCAWQAESPRKQPRSDEPFAAEQNLHRRSGYDDNRRYCDLRYKGMAPGAPRSRFDEDRRFGAADRGRLDYDDLEPQPSNINFFRHENSSGHHANNHVDTASYTERRHAYDLRFDSSRAECHDDSIGEGRRHGESASYGHHDVSPPSSARYDRTPGGWHEYDFDDFQYRSRGREHKYDRSRQVHEYDRSRQMHEHDRSRQVHEYDRSRQEVDKYDRSRQVHEYDRSRQVHEYDRSWQEEHEYNHNRRYDDRHQDRSPRHGSLRDRDRSRDRSRKHRSERKKPRSLDSRDRRRSRSNGPSQDRGPMTEIHSEENDRANGE